MSQLLKPLIHGNCQSILDIQIKFPNNSNCFDCNIPSNSKLERDIIRWQSFSQPSLKKSDSMIAVLAYIVAIPLQKSHRMLYRPSTKPHPFSNDIPMLLLSYLSNAALSIE